MVQKAFEDKSEEILGKITLTLTTRSRNTP